jgi:hypothetical protein
MGLEFLFAPLTILIFVVVIVGLVLLQRLLFNQAFEVVGLKRVALGYAFVLVLSLLLGVVLGGGALRESVANFMLACYASLVFVSIGLLPLSLLLARQGKISVGTVVGAGVLLSMLLGFAMVLSIGVDRVIERGVMGWLWRQASILGFLVAVSAAFSMGLRVR